MNVSLSKIFFTIVSFTTLLTIACNEGLKPEPEVSTLSGKGFIKGTLIVKNGIEGWKKSKDSIITVRVAGFLDNPPSDIINSVLNGKAYLNSDTVALYQDSTDFYIPINDSPKTIQYLGVALQYQKSSFLAQRVIGIYTESGDTDKPSTIVVMPRDTVKVRIYIDFEKLPRQPSL